MPGPHPIAVIRRVPVFTATVVAELALVAMVVFLATHPPQGASLAYLLQGVTAVWLGMWLAWLGGGNPRVAVYEHGLDVTNIVRRFHIPWSAIADVVTTDEVVIRLKDNTEVRPAVGDWSLAARARGNPRQHALRERINHLRAVAEGSGGEVRRGYDVKLVPFLLLLAALLAFTWLVH